MLKNLLHNRKKPGSRAQAMVEFAIVAPILMLMLIGIIEVGRMVFLYAAVTNASREAVRFGSAIGLDDTGELKYRHCSKIREVARQASFFVTIPDSAIVIQYDHGPGTSVFHTCPPGVDVEPGYFVNLVPGQVDRIKVTVTGQYAPYTSIIPWGARPFVSSSARTILGFVALSAGGGGPIGPGPTNTPTATIDPSWTYTPTPTVGPTDTPTVTPTSTPTNTPTAVFVATFTPTSTPTITRTPTNTPTATPTLTSTPTATFTASPTATATAVAGCTAINASSLSMSNNSQVVSMTITNPNAPFTVTSIQVNWDVGSTNNTLTSIQMGSSDFWAVTDNTGAYTLTPSSTVTLQGNNHQTVVQFTLNQNYKNPATGKTTITVKLSSPECGNITISKAR